MTIQMLATWNGMEEDGVFTLSATEEARLIAIGLARPYTQGAMDGSGVVPVSGRFSPSGSLTLRATDGSGNLVEAPVITAVQSSRVPPAAAVVPSIAGTRIVMVAGQSLSIGTRNTSLSVPTPPVQPELPATFKTFNGVSPAGNGTALTSDANTASFIRYAELTGPNGTQGYYTHGVGFFRYMDTIDATGQNWLWCNAGIGGQTIAALDSGGGTNAYANQQKMLARAKLLDASADVTAILFSQGESNWSVADPAAYTTALTTYKTNQLAAVTAQFASSTPKFLIDQCGDGATTIKVHVAQANAARSGLATVVGPKYWLNRLYPNIKGNEQLHLNAVGYTYQGEMFASALECELRSAGSFTPTILRTVEYVNATTIRIRCSTPNGGGLAIDTATLPACPGYGIDIEKPDLTKIVPTSVTVSGNEIVCQFGETVYPDYRVRIGYTLQDVTQDGGASTNYIPCTNIRGAVANASRNGLAPWFDWLMLDRYVMGKTEAGYVAPGVLGAELWRTQKVGLTDGLLTDVVFDGTNMTVTRNGVTNAPVATAGFVDGGTNADALYWALKSGKTYRVQGECVVTSGAGAHEIRIYVSTAVNTKRTSVTNPTLSAFSVDLAATSDGMLTLQLNNTALVGRIRNISVREVL